MKKVTFLAILLIIINFQTYSQKSRDVLYLKNGSIINGTLVEVSNNQYKIRTSDGSIFIFSGTEVERYTKELSVFEGRKQKGLGLALESGFLMGAPDNPHPMPFSFNCLVNYTYNTKNVFGIGTGVEFIEQPFTPLYVEYKYLISERRTSPFFFLRGGALFHLAGDKESNSSTYPQYNYTKGYKGGASLTIGTGVSWAKEFNETYLSFAYRYARTSYTQDDYLQHETTYINNYNRLEIKFGFKF
jgi:hypothetical protein